MALTDDLISHWKLNEASGNAVDAHGSNTLTETSGTIASGAGKIDASRDFESGDTEYFEKTDNADLSTGNIDFTVCFWAKAESAINNMCAVTKGGFSAASHEYALYINTSGGTKFRFTLGGSSLYILDSSVSVSAGTWYFVVAWHDAVGDGMNIQVNNGSVDGTSHLTGVPDSATAFRIGASSAGNYWDGLIESVSFWKRVLTSDERTELYNSGNGLDYDNFVTKPFPFRRYYMGAS
jgi:hypothetical protein